MKTQIIHLESFDDIHSIKDQISWGQGDRIILVWPLRGQLLDNRLDLQLLKRHTHSRGMLLALVTRNNNIRQFASDLGIPVFRSLRQAKQLPWEYTLQEEKSPAFTPRKDKNLRQLVNRIHTRQRPAWLEQPSTRWIAFASALISCLVLFIFFYPSAQVTLSPQSETQKLGLTITANPNISKYNLSGAVPARQISIIVEGRDEMPVSGEMSTPQETAKGEVVFTNLTIQPITIPQRTLVRTLDSPPVRFATTTAEVLPAQAGVQRSIPVEALNPGADGNLPAESLIVVEGSLGLYVSVTNPSPTTGGSDRINAAPTSDDYDALAENLLDALWETALEEARGELDSRDIILNTTPKEVNILEETFTPSEPQPSPRLSLLQRVEFKLLVVSWKTFEEMINLTLDATLSEGVSPLPDTVKITSLSTPEFQDDNTAVWEIHAEREIFRLENTQEAIQVIRGMKIDQAINYLDQRLSLKSQPDIHVNPSWWPWMPFLEMRITVHH
jgi:hypothetical protein